MKLYSALFVTTALVSVGVAPLSVAQEALNNAPAEEVDAVSVQDVIVVTAQKKEERLLDVPIAISAVTADTLTDQNLNRLTDYFDRVPGLQFSGQRIRALSLRGVTTGGATSPTLAVLVDDVQFGGTTGGQTPIPDFDASALERIEVIRGPQGTLYGASSLGGLIKYVLKEPDTQDLFGRFEVGGTSVADGGTGWVTRGTVNVPISDKVAVLASGFYRDDAAYLDNANAGAASAEDVNTREVWGYRGAVSIQPFENLKIVGSALYQEQDVVNSDLAITSGGVPICADCYPPSVGSQSAPVSFDPVYGDLTLNTLDSLNASTYEVYSARAELDLGGAQVTSVSAWSKADNIITSDVTAVFLGLFQLPFSYQSPAGSSVTIGNADSTEKFSQELRVDGTVGSFDWLLGAFYTDEETSIDQSLFLFDVDGSLAATPFAGNGPGTYKEKAVFGTLTWEATEKFDLQVGARYAENEQTSAIDVIIDGPAVPLFGPSGLQEAPSKDNALTWVVSPTYHFTPDMMGYVRVATGYRPGGPNIENAVVPSYDPDEVTNYEVGFKGRVIPGVLVVDAAVFQIDWKDIQLQGTAPSQQTFQANGGKARSRGVEFAASIFPRDGMKIDTSVALTDAELSDDLPGINNGLVGLSGDPLPYTADVTANISIDQEFDISANLEGSIGAAFTYVGDRPSEFLSVNATRNDRFDIPSYSTFDVRGRVTYKEDWALSAYVRNLFDERGIAVAQHRNGTNVPTALFIQPRSVGVTVSKSF